VIFVHSGWRTGSTFIWAALRKSARVVAYYEVFHDALETITVADLAQGGPEAWRSRHPPGAPYMLEYLPLIRPEGGVAGFAPGMSYACFIPPDGCCGALSDAEIAYVGGLIRHAEGRGRIPVLTDTRSLGRVRGLKAAFPGLHVLLYRNVFHQWCSFTDQAFEGNPYFLDRFAEIVRLNRHDKVIDDLHRMFPLSGPAIRDPNMFYLFVFVHLHLYLQAAGAADLIVDLQLLETDPAHRDAVEACFAGQDVPVDLSGARTSIAYSLCRPGSAADVAGRLNILGAVVIDAAPDAAGRAFGAKVLAEFAAEYARHEFYSGALRGVLFGPKGPLAACDRLPAAPVPACDAAPDELAQARAERDRAREERDAALAELAALRSDRAAGRVLRRRARYRLLE
jgi:hypothetical protein